VLLVVVLGSLPFSVACAKRSEERKREKTREREREEEKGGTTGIFGEMRDLEKEFGTIVIQNMYLTTSDNYDKNIQKTKKITNAT
jgi:hypothetical protein